MLTKSKTKPPVTFEYLWRNKFIDGGTTLGSLIAALEEAADLLRAMREEGVALDSECVDDDYYTLTTTDVAVAKRFGFEKEEACP